MPPRAARYPPGVKLSRRDLLRGGAALALGGLGLDAFALEPAWLEVTRWEVRVPGLASELEGFRVAHVTDVHLPGRSGLHRSLQEALARERVDLVALTGDLVESEAGLASVPDFLDRLRTGQATLVATLGNWEHWGQVPLADYAAALRRVDAALLVNESRGLPRGLQVLGTDDSCSGHADLGRTLLNAPEGRPRLLLSHAPGLFDGPLPERLGAALCLSGHTHGGQVTLGGGALSVPPGSGRFVAGAYATPAGPLFVSRGLGTSVVPARFACRPELAVFTLREGGPAGVVAEGAARHA